MTRFIEAGNEQRPARMSFRVLKKILHTVGLSSLSDLARFADATKFDQIPEVCFHAFRAGAEAEGQKVDFTIKVVEDWVDEDFSIWMDVQALIADEMISTAEKQQGKKKQRETASVG